MIRSAEVRARSTSWVTKYTLSSPAMRSTSLMNAVALR